MKRLFIPLFFCVASFLLSSVGVAAGENQKVFSVGDMRVEMLTDEAGEGDASILQGATPELLQKYIPTGKYPMVVKSALIRNGDQIFLIDAGLGNKLIQNLQERNIVPANVETILITHMHFDHINGLMHEGQAAFPNAKLYISEFELAYWTNNDNIKKFPEQQQEMMTGFFQNSQNVLAAYKDKVVSFSPGELAEGGKELFPGINGIAAYGHTPGHTVFLLHNQDSKLLVLGDAFHVGVIQFPNPGVTVIYDVNQEDAAKTRHALFDFAATHAIPMSGMHQAEADFGQVKLNQKEKGGYEFGPLK